MALPDGVRLHKRRERQKYLSIVQLQIRLNADSEIAETGFHKVRMHKQTVWRSDWITLVLDLNLIPNLISNLIISLICNRLLGWATFATIANLTDQNSKIAETGFHKVRMHKQLSGLKSLMSHMI